MYIFSDNIKQALIDLVNGTIVTPAQPPYVNVTKGKHTYTQKLGKLLRQRNLKEKEVKLLVEQYKEINSVLEDYKISYSREYVEVYKEPLYAIGSTSVSCMTGNNSVRVYGYDTRLAMLLAYKNSKLVLRTLVRDDLKQYVRLYIDHNFIKEHTAKAIVTKEGFSQGDLEGIELEYIEEEGNIVCPYLDNLSTFDITSDRILVITKGGEFDGSTTNGYVELEATCECGCCGDRVPEDGTAFVNDEAICSHCLDYKYTYYEGEYYADDDCIVNKSNNELIPVCKIDLAHVICTEDGDWYDSDEVVCINDCFYHIDECKKLVTTDDNGNDYALDDDAIYNSEELDNLPKGYWLKEQIEDVLATLRNILDSIQMDIFEDKPATDLVQAELATIITEITKIEKLL